MRLSLLSSALIGLLASEYWPANRALPDPEPDCFTCSAPQIIDGDTFRCGAERIRLASIDAPDMPGHCRPGRRCTPGDPDAARDFLRRLLHGGIRCQRLETDHYGRTIARCEASGLNVACAMVDAGHAVERYGRLRC
ncbi:MAG: hypothetical protein Tsb0016_05300 [Sphingomonadales bacterium]